MRIILFQLISQLGYHIQIIHVTVHKWNISSGLLCTYPTISYDWDTSILLMPWLHSHPTHVATYQKPHALVHISTCTCILHSCTHMHRLPVMHICQSFTCVHDHVYYGQSFIHIHFIQYSILVWYRNPYQTYSCCTGLMMQTPQTKMVINYDQNHGWPAFKIRVPDSTLEYFLP